MTLMGSGTDYCIPQQWKGNRAVFRRIIQYVINRVVLVCLSVGWTVQMACWAGGLPVAGRAMWGVGWLWSRME